MAPRRHPDWVPSTAAATMRWPDLTFSAPILDEEAIEQLGQVVRLVESSPADHRRAATSIRLNESLRTAATIAVRHGWADSMTALLEEGLARQLTDVFRGLTEQAALDEHYAAHPDARPDLWEIVVAAARLEGDPIADHPDLIRRAVEALGEGAGIDRALAWASGALAASAPA